jgi:hypothetical protein
MPVSKKIGIAQSFLRFTEGDFPLRAGSSFGFGWLERDSNPSAHDSESTTTSGIYVSSIKGYGFWWLLTQGLLRCALGYYLPPRRGSRKIHRADFEAPLCLPTQGLPRGALGYYLPPPWG